MTVAALPDEPARIRALSDHASSLMLEAAAGTGKTALIAGRVTMMLAAGIEPRRIAAVTFGEYAASELNARVAKYVDDLLSDRVPAPMRMAFPVQPTVDQRANLERARASFDELTCATIHAFCQMILTAHAIDANVDPGARVIDEQEREAVLDLVFDAWLDERLSGPPRDDDPIAHLARENPRGVVSDLRQIAMMRIGRRNASAPRPDLAARPDRAFADAVAAFRGWYDAGPKEPRTASVLEDLEKLAGFFGAPFDAMPAFATLWFLSDPPLYAISEEDRDGVSRNLVAPSLELAWRDAAGAKDGPARHEAYKQYFSAAAEQYARLVNHIAACVMWRVSAELDNLLAAYQSYKRRAAMLDFEDLLCLARDLVRDNVDVRAVIAEQYQHVLVDEFQDTDPVQAELLFRIAAATPHADWTQCPLRPGSLFMVGDPKQAIYGFRGGDTVTYGRARGAIERRWPTNVLQLTSNFRSRPGIITHVNACFEASFEVADQPDYVHLVATLDEAGHGLPAAAKLEVTADARGVNALRNAEASAVAELCRRLIGSYPLGDRKLRAGDIALLAPRGTELLRYEQALQAQGIPFVSQAGKTLLKRQEAQDLLALARTLANRRDHAAFGALMRGPLIGLTESELLDIAAALPASPHQPRLSMFSDPDAIEHSVARDTLRVLQELSSKARESTPLLILSEALERLNVRATLAERREARGERAWANIEALLERTRPYAVSGLRKFVRDFHRDWKAGASAMEGRLDAEGDALQIVTMHSAKGLEWPVVIPINAATEPRRPSKFIYRGADETLHWIIGNVRSPELAASLNSAEREETLESVRLWYVACTRARELLVVPKLVGARRTSWAAMVDLKHGVLPEWDMDAFEPVELEAPLEPENCQDASVFREERDRIARSVRPVRWRTPSDYDLDRVPLLETLASEIVDAPTAAIEGAGRLRGLIIHKLMEEVLTGEITDDATALRERAVDLTAQLASQFNVTSNLPNASEMAGAVVRTLALPAIAEGRQRLVPELSLYAQWGDNELLAGRADAILYDANGQAEVVFDWKSDVDPTEEVMQDHARQLSAYLTVTGAPRGGIVYMTKGLIRWTAP